MENEYRNVVILGAGASAQAGIPLLGTFVDKMRDIARRWQLGQRGPEGNDLQILEDALRIIDDLDGYHSRASFDRFNIEDILNILTFDELGREAGAPSKLDTFTKAIRVVLEESSKFRHEESIQKWKIGGHGEPNDKYHLFWHRMIQLGANAPALITFNYDLVLERSLYESFYRNETQRQFLMDKSVALRYSVAPFADFAVTAVNASKNAKQSGNSEIPWLKGELSALDTATHEIPYLKLHGSLNWDKDASAGEPLSISSTKAAENPLILPPVFNKYERGNIQGAWREALRLLRNAYRIIVVGYSLPQTDVSLQFFLKAALGQATDLDRVTLFDPCLFDLGACGQGLRQRYEECFAPNFLKKLDFTPSPRCAEENPQVVGRFSHFVDMLGDRESGLLFYR